MRYIGVGRRAVAWFIDGVISAALVIPFGEYSHEGGVYVARWNGGRFVVAFVLVALYFVLFEWLASATPGKFFTGIRVRRADGAGRIGFGQSLARNLARFVDAFPYLIPYVVGAIAVRNSSTKQRLGDRWGTTVVIAKGTDRAVTTLPDAPSGPLPPAPIAAGAMPTDRPSDRIDGLPPPPPAP
jgi:uncharacterized RDD family membrane protein YckC